MIKLNNKNITYVALADSSNSIKAPKEIWYADSNNSVKLVYRRKDALIEGEDYEKYHWLKGDGDCYIDTLQKYRPYSDSIDLITKDNLYPNRETNLNKYNQEEFMFGYFSMEVVRVGVYIPTVLRVGVNVLKYNSSNQPDWITYCASTNVNSNSIHNIHLNKVTDNKYSFEYNGTTFNDRTTVLEFPSNYEVQGSLYLFNLNNPTTSQQYFNGAFNTYIHYRDDIAIQNFIPCKLLKPVPKWLDANGIRRQVGECGMIDLVSGKFYGNVNSNGTFTVENYYERKEWLIADIPAETRCIDLLINSDEISYTIVISKVGNTTLFETIGNKRYYAYATNSTLRIWDITTSKSDSNDAKIDLGIQDGVILDIDSDISSFKINNIDCPKVDFPISAVVFRSGGLQSNTITQTSSIFVDGIERYIPCILTMDLPASMDANGISRTKGTSGMWDLVSDRFYGNVASSGTFKAVNLAEGVDYEVHQWLSVNMPRGYFMALPLDSSNFSYQRIYTSIGITAHLSSNQDEYTYFSAKLTGIGIWNGSETTNYKSVNISNLSVVCDSNQLLFNSVEFPIYGFPPRVTFYNSSTATTATNTVLKQSAIAVDGIERYIPVRLLRPLPSYLDANGKARHQFECGMLDLKTMKFYGNVNTTGTFTVSDN